LLQELQWKPKSIYLKQKKKTGAVQKASHLNAETKISLLASTYALHTYFLLINQCNITNSHNHRKFKSVTQKKKNKNAFRILSVIFPPLDFEALKEALGSRKKL
jgi:hypothetical protein